MDTKHRVMNFRGGDDEYVIMRSVSHPSVYSTHELHTILFHHPLRIPRAATSLSPRPCSCTRSVLTYSPSPCSEGKRDSQATHVRH